MMEVLHSPSSSSSPSISAPTNTPIVFNQSLSDEEEEVREKRDEERRDQLPLLALLVALFRKSFWAACKSDGGGAGGGGAMEISGPRDVQHVNHVTFDRFDGFLGLPVEFEPEVPRWAPSASATVFGVSAESMQLSYDPRGNSIPSILLLMQQHLYSQSGLQVEGIFRITAGNSQEVFVREQLNRGMVPGGTDVHCLAGLIKAWFRELPRGLLDSLSPEQVMQCQSEDDCEALVRLLPPTEAALLDWAINLMADVVQHDHFNKMNAHNIAMVFAPNMTQMADPLTALMHAVQVMNFLKTLIEKTLRERQDPIPESPSALQMDPSDDSENQRSLRLQLRNRSEPDDEMELDYAAEDTVSGTDWETSQLDEDYTEESDESRSCEATPLQNEFEEKKGGKTDHSSEPKLDSQKAADYIIDESKCKVTSNLSRLTSMAEWFGSLALNSKHHHLDSSV